MHKLDDQRVIKERYYNEIRKKIVEETNGLKEGGRKFPHLTGWSKMLQKREKSKIKSGKYQIRIISK